MSVHELPPSVLISSTMPSYPVEALAELKKKRSSNEMVKVPLPTDIVGEIRDSSAAALGSISAQGYSSGVICRRFHGRMSGCDCAVPETVHGLIVAPMSSLAELFGISS